MPTAILFENVNYGGRAHDVTADAPSIPAPLDANASSVKTDHKLGWTVFWESRSFDEGDDSLWIEGARQDPDVNLTNLHTLSRPHGNNHWGDRIRAVSFSTSGPSGSNENRTIYYANGRLTVG